jgi:hypothetical protein
MSVSSKWPSEFAAFAQRDTFGPLVSEAENVQQLLAWEAGAANLPDAALRRLARSTWLGAVRAAAARAADVAQLAEEQHQRSAEQEAGQAAAAGAEAGSVASQAGVDAAAGGERAEASAEDVVMAGTDDGGAVSAGHAGLAEAKHSHGLQSAQVVKAETDEHRAASPPAAERKSGCVDGAALMVRFIGSQDCKQLSHSQCCIVMVQAHKALHASLHRISVMTTTVCGSNSEIQHHMCNARLACLLLCCGVRSELATSGSVRTYIICAGG